MTEKSLDTNLIELIVNNPAEAVKKIINSGDVKSIIESLWNLTEEEISNKAKVKAIKKTLYLLKSRGVDVDAYKNRVTEGSKKEQKETQPEVFKSFLFIPDSYMNSRGLITVYINSAAAYEIIDIIYNFEQGIKSVQKAKTSKRSIEKIVENYPESIEVPANFLFYRLNRVINPTSKEDRGRNKLPHEMIHLIDNARPEEHPVLNRYKGIVTGLITAEETEILFGRSEISRFTLPEDEVQVYKKEIEFAKSSLLVVNNKTPEERINDAVGRFIKNYFTRERLYSYRELLLDIALYFDKIGEQVLAKRLIFHAENLIIPNFNISQHPLIQMLVYKSLLV